MKQSQNPSKLMTQALNGNLQNKVREFKTSVIKKIENQDSVKRTSNVRQSIARASVKFELQGNTETGEMVIENERLKTSLQVLNQKLKAQIDNEKVTDDLKVKNQSLNN